MSQTQGGVTTNYTYGYTANSNILASMTVVGGATTNYSHDNNGNRTAQGASTSYNYSVPNRQTTATVSGTATTYLYRGDVLRHSETRGGVTTTYLWDVNRGVPQLLFDGSSWYLYGRGRIARVNGSGTQFFHHDFTGNVRAVSKLRTSNAPAFGGNDYRLCRRAAGRPEQVPLRFRVGIPWDWKQESRLRRFEVTPDRKPVSQWFGDWLRYKSCGQGSKRTSQVMSRFDGAMADSAVTRKRRFALTLRIMLYRATMSVDC